MSTFRDPVGPLPPSTYWRRRLIVGLGLLALIVIILLIVFRPGGDESATPPTETETTEPTEPTTTSTTPTTPADVASCRPGQIELNAISDNTVYAAGEQPQLKLEIINTGTADCSLNVGTTEQKFVVMSGPEQIWNSQHCDSDPQDDLMVLKPDQAMQTNAVVWDRTKSSESNCNAGPISTIADATYLFHVEIGNIKSDEIRLRILH